MKLRGSRAFTLLELLVVVGLIAALAVGMFSALSGGGQSASLQSAQATLANLVTAARTKASATGRKTRLLVSVEPSVPERYLRTLVLQLAREPGASPANWDTIQAITLPAGVFVVPAQLTGLTANPESWKRSSDPGADLVSDLFAGQNLSHALEGDAAPQQWTGVAFTPNGTLAALTNGPPRSGAVVLALGRNKPPGTYDAGQLPVQLTSPDAVRGLVLSAYGVPALLDDRRAF
jgi:prepilin-type N-terminal cleavage/methylation domain-containing protein